MTNESLRVEDRLIGDLERECRHFKEALDSLGISPEQQKALLAQVGKVGEARHRALAYASTLPTTAGSYEDTRNRISIVCRQYLG